MSPKDGADLPEVLSGPEIGARKGEPVGDGDKVPVRYDDTPKIPAHYDDTPKIPSNDAAFAEGQTGTPSAASRRISMPWQSAATPVEETPGGEGGVSEKGPGAGQRIWGLRRKTFFILLAVAFLIFAAAIGGGIGGGLSARSRTTQPSTR